MNWTLFSAVVLFLSLVSASYHRRRGYFFWRTFIMALMGFAGMGLLIYQLFFV
ncbi:MAG: hypothetical protein KBF73_05525 [Flavobacteriales bacterium]|nr:hypothetical protein [Flavobacteriales bacterium]